MNWGEAVGAMRDGNIVWTINPCSERKIQYKIEGSRLMQDGGTDGLFWQPSDLQHINTIFTKLDPFFSDFYLVEPKYTLTIQEAFKALEKGTLDTHVECEAEKGALYAQPALEYFKFQPYLIKAKWRIVK